jgi:CheY-like chemotaxis protein
MQKRKKRVLLVDDDVGLTSSVKANLQLDGRFHVWAENKAVRGHLAARMFRPDLILLDLHMPHLDGAEVATRIKGDRDLRDVQIVFYTALVDQSEHGLLANERFVSKSSGLPGLLLALDDLLPG